MKIDDDWTPAAVENRPAGFIDRAASLPHLILPLVCLADGVSNLVGLVRWVNAPLNVLPDTQFTLMYGVVFTGLGLFELRYWWRRLRGQ